MASAIRLPWGGRRWLWSSYCIDCHVIQKVPQMAPILQIFELVLHKAYADALSLQSRSLSRDVESNKCSTDLLYVLHLLQRAWHAVLQSNFNASCFISKAGELFIWGKTQNIACNRQVSLTLDRSESQVCQIQCFSEWNVWVLEAVGAGGGSATTQNPSGRTGWKKLPSDIKSPMESNIRATLRQILSHVWQGMEAWFAFSFSWQDSL